MWYLLIASPPSCLLSRTDEDFLEGLVDVSARLERVLSKFNTIVVTEEEASRYLAERGDRYFNGLYCVPDNADKYWKGEYMYMTSSLV